MANLKQDFQTDLLHVLHPIVQQEEVFQYHTNQNQNQMSQFQNSFTHNRNQFQIINNQNINFSDHFQEHSKNQSEQFKHTHMQTATDKLFQQHDQASFDDQHPEIGIQEEYENSKPQMEKSQDKSYHPSDPNIEVVQQQSSSIYEDEVTGGLGRGHFRKKLLLKTLNLTQKDQMLLGGKVISGLQKNIVSLPFRQPVDYRGLQIPDYLEIIKQPMDLRTIKNKLADDLYATIDEIYSDIELIISNSMKYNELNPDFIRLTRNFQKSYNKIRRDCQRNMRKLKIEQEKKFQTLKAQMHTKKPVKPFESRFPTDDVEIVSNYEFKQLTKLAKNIKKLSAPELIELFSKIGIRNEETVDLKVLTTKQIRGLIRQVQKIQKQRQELIRNQQKKQHSHLTSCDHDYRHQV